MPASTATPVGRAREIAMLRAFLEAPPASGALLIEGEPGIGKTTLLSLGVAEARDAGYRVLRAAPAATETKLSFSALGDLLENTGPGLLEALPPPQRRALGGALLRVDVEGRPPDRRTVSVAVLEVIRSMAAEGPVLIAIDDIQWLDRPSARVLEYTARRLRTERVAFLLSRRTGDSTDPSGLLGALGPDRLRHLELTGLSVGALGRVLANQQGPVLNRPLLLKVRRTSGGNPLFAQEIVRALRRDGQPTPSHSSLPIPDSLRAAVRDRVGELPAGAREAVLVVAALASPTRNVVRDALGPRAESSVAAAVDADVVTLENGRVLLAHPLIGSVLYDEATESERRSVHARLAEAVADPEEKARHLALAATGPDAAVAGALRRAAGIARSRGAPEAAAELSDRAVELTPPEETDVRNELTVEAADHHFASGDADRAREALERLAAALPPGPERARILWRLARIRFITESLGQAGAILRQSLDEAGDDVALRAHVEQALAFTEMVGGNLPLAQQHARSAVALAARADDAAVTALALSRLATTEFILGMGLDRPSFERSMRLEGALDPDIPIEWRPAYNFAGVLMYADDFSGAREILLSLLRGARDRGDEGALPSILFLMSELECRAGD
ncbi:MAG TPA: AAA family ATPase, partial [Actinomycetota bacterium]|nr:AAA family ATPase [Actinomycetota bacterium]